MKNILCIGGAGQLGSKVISVFQKHKVVNVDFKPHSSAAHNIILQQQAPPLNNRLVIDSVKSLSLKFSAILVTAGGWTGGNIKNEDYFEAVNTMNEVNLYPSLLAAHLATKYMEPQGLISFTGAAAVYKEPQPEMLGYALSKAGVHYLATALSEQASQYNIRVVTILPTVIDTETNRKFMPDSDFSTWAKPEHIGELLLGWVEGLNTPANGSFVELKVKKGCLEPTFL
jgi:dihydropteridine reductase